MDASLARSGKTLECAPPPPWVCLKMAAVISNKQASESLRGAAEVRTDGSGRVESVKRGQRGSPNRLV